MKRRSDSGSFMPSLPTRFAANEDWYGWQAEDPSATILPFEPRQIRRLIESVPHDEAQSAGVLEVLGLMEDILMRLVNHTQVTICVMTDALSDSSVVITRKSSGLDGKPLQELLNAASTQLTYAWSEQGRSGSFITGIEANGDELIVHLASMQQIQHWPQGEDACGWLRDLLRRLNRRAL